MKNLLSAICLLSFSLLSPIASTRSSDSGTLVYSHPSNCGPLNPHMYSPNQMYAQEMVYEPLVQLAADGEIVPCLAVGWDRSEDGRVYDFHLREGVTFSDGQPFDAGAVVKNFEHIMANRQRHAWLDIVNKIESFEAVDAMTFRLTLNAPYYPALDDLSLPRPFRFLSPAAFPDSGITRDGIKIPAGTGPWRLAESSLGEYDLFERNESHWGEKPKSGKVLVKIIPDPTSRAMALQTGEIDLVYGQGQIGYDTFNALANSPDFVTAVSPPVGTVAAAINSNRSPGDELAVRRALQHLADKDTLVRGVFMNTQPRADTLFPDTVPYCDIGLTPYGFDLEKAKSILDAAGWSPGAGGVREKDGARLELDFCFVGNDAAHKAIAEVLQGQAAAAGIGLNLIGEEEDSFFLRQRDGNFGIIMNSTWGPPFEPHAFLGSMRQPSHADYQAQLGLPMKAELDRAITRVLGTRDDEERRNLYRTVLTTLHEQAVYIPVHYSTLLAAYRKGRIKDFRFGPGKSRYPFEFLEKAQ